MVLVATIAYYLLSVLKTNYIFHQLFSSGQRLATAVTFLRKVLPAINDAEMGPANSYTLRRNTASIMKDFINPTLSKLIVVAMKTRPLILLWGDGLVFV